MDLKVKSGHISGLVKSLPFLTVIKNIFFGLNALNMFKEHPLKTFSKSLSQNLGASNLSLWLKVATKRKRKRSKSKSQQVQKPPV